MNRYFQEAPLPAYHYRSASCQPREALPPRQFASILDFALASPREKSVDDARATSWRRRRGADF